MEECIRGMPVLAAEINKKGGLLGKHPIEIVYRDDQTKPDVGAREARQLILNEKVNAIFGVYSSAVALAVQEIIHEHKTLHFAATSNSSAITTENHTPYTYQWCPDSDMQSGAVVVAVTKLIKERNWTKFVSIGQDYEWGRATHKRLHYRARQVGTGSQGEQAALVQARRDRFHRPTSPPSWLSAPTSSIRPSPARTTRPSCSRRKRRACSRSRPIPGGVDVGESSCASSARRCRAG